MVAGENFCLRLNLFQKNIATSWQKLQAENDFCDVILACEDKQIKTHKLILSACSPVLRNILRCNQNPHSLIYLRRVRYRDLQNLLNFMYQGEVNVAKEDLASFLEVAEDLDVRGLSERNAENSDSNQENPEQFTDKNIPQFKKRNKSIIDNNFDHFAEDIIDNDNHNFIPQTKNKNVVSVIEKKQINCETFNNSIQIVGIFGSIRKQFMKEFVFLVINVIIKQKRSHV